MWCSNCQQDVPMIASSDDTACCARCGRVAELADSEMETTSVEAISEMSEWGLELDAVTTESSTAVADPPLLSDDWLLDEEFRRLQSRYGKNCKFTARRLRPTESLGLAASEHSGASPTQTLVSQPAPAATVAQRRRNSTVAWLILSLGLMSFVCGGMLLGWSLLAGRNELWNLGMPMALAGQFGLLLGLILQLDSLWQANRRTADTLDHVDHRLQEIDHATTILRTHALRPGSIVLRPHGLRRESATAVGRSQRPTRSAGRENGPALSGDITCRLVRFLTPCSPGQAAFAAP